MIAPFLYHWWLAPAPFEFNVRDTEPSHCVRAPTLVITGCAGVAVTTIPVTVAVSTLVQLVVGLVAVTVSVVVPTGSAEVTMSRFAPVPAITELREVAP